MNISHENVDAINAVVNVALAPEDYNPQVDKEIKAQAKKAKLPGSVQVKFQWDISDVLMVNLFYLMRSIN
jgi:hypothetical protein